MLLHKEKRHLSWDLRSVNSFVVVPKLKKKLFWKNYNFWMSCKTVNKFCCTKQALPNFFLWKTKIFFLFAIKLGRFKLQTIFSYVINTQAKQQKFEKQRNQILVGLTLGCTWIAYLLCLSAFYLIKHKRQRYLKKSQ